MQTNRNVSTWRRAALSGRTLLTALAIAVMAIALPGCPGTGPNPCDGDPCDDGVFCNGEEVCTQVDTTVNSNGYVCSNGVDPCADSNGAPLCNEANDECVECLTAADCDDDLFCNGTETCTAGVCGDGTSPCTAGQECDEDANACVTPCATDADCTDDGNFCNGDEICNTVTGVCESEGDPCEGNVATPVCNEAGNSCVECLTNADCDTAAGETCVNNVCQGATPECNSNGDCADDGLFCNGDEFCDTTGFTCGHTGSPCAEGQTCTEGASAAVCTTPGGTTFTLTTEADLFVGSAADDTFNAAAGTLNGAGGVTDVLDGANGDNDTLNATIIGAATGFKPVIVGIEVWNLVSSGANNFFELSAVDGVDEINVTGNAALTFEDIPADLGAAFNLNNSTRNLGLEFATLAGADDEASLGLSGVDGSTVTLTSVVAGDLETLNLTSGGTTTNAFELVAGANVNNIDTVVLDGAADVEVEVDDAVFDGNEIDDSDFTGVLNIVVNSDLDADFDAADLGTIGTLTLTANQANATVISGIQSGLEVVIAPTGAAAQHVDNTLTFTGSFAGSTTSLTLALEGTGTGVNGAITANGVETFNLVSGGDSANTIHSVVLGTSAFATEAIVITGDQDLTVGNASTADRIDASDFVGELSVIGSAASNEIIGGTADDVIDGGAGDDILDGGDGDDELTSNDGDDSVTGGDGADTFVVGHDAGTSSDLVEDFDADEDDVIAIDLSEVNAAVTDVVTGAGNVTLGAADDVDIATVASGGTLVANNTDNLFKLTNTTGINSYADVDLTGGAGLIDLANNTANGDAVLFMFYDADDASMVLGYIVDTDSDADSDIDGSNDTFTAIATVPMTAAEYTALTNADFDFVP